MIRLKNAAAKAPARCETAQKSATHNSVNASAEEQAIAALSFIAQDEKLLERFLSISGLAAGNLRRAALQPGFLAGVLSFLLEHEPDLLRFCAQTNRRPENIARAYAALPGGRELSSAASSFL